jgi:hypothetical protein
MRLVKGVTSGPLRSAPAEAGLVEMLDYSLVAQRVIGLENQQVVGPARQDLLGDCVWQPMASSVTMLFSSASWSGSSGIAVSSLDAS